MAFLKIYQIIGVTQFILLFQESQDQIKPLQVTSGFSLFQGTLMT